MGKISYVALAYFMRKQFVIGFTIAFYILSIYFLFFTPNLIWWLVFAVFFFSFVHFFVIEIRKADISSILLIIIVATILEVMINGFSNFFYVLWIWFFNLAVFFLIWDIYDEVYNRIEISSYKVFTMWVKMYSLLLSATFALSFLWTYRSFNLTCDEIYKKVNSASKFVMRNFWVEIPKIKKDTKIKDVINGLKEEKISWNWNISNLSWKVLTNLSGSNNVLLSWNTVNQKVSDNQEFKWIENVKFSDLIKLKFWKNIIINQIMENKKILDKSLCKTIVQNIKEKYTNPHFQITVIFLIFLLFYPFIRVFLYILSVINFIWFKMMNWVKIYQFKTIVEDVESIE